MMKRKNSPQKKFQEEMTAKEFLKTDINNIFDQNLNFFNVYLFLRQRQGMNGGGSERGRHRI